MQGDRALGAKALEEQAYSRRRKPYRLHLDRRHGGGSGVGSEVDRQALGQVILGFIGHCKEFRLYS